MRILFSFIMILGALNTISAESSTLTTTFQDTLLTEVTIPSVFTPNRDSENDLFKPTGPFTRLHMKIYNRWGALLFKSDHLNEGWNGRTTAGEEVPAGTYFYIIETDIDTYKGSLTLIR